MQSVMYTDLYRYDHQKNKSTAFWANKRGLTTKGEIQPYRIHKAYFILYFKQ